MLFLITQDFPKFYLKLTDDKLYVELDWENILKFLARTMSSFFFQYDLDNTFLI